MNAQAAFQYLLVFEKEAAFLTIMFGYRPSGQSKDMWYINDISFDRKVLVLLGEPGEVIFNLCTWPNTKSYEPDSFIWTVDMPCDYSSASAGTRFIIFLSLVSYRQLLRPLLPWKMQTPCCPDQPGVSQAWDGTDLNSSLPELWVSCNHRGSSCVVSVH